MKRILFEDYTLRQPESGSAHKLLFREKVSVCRTLDALGVDFIELPGTGNPREDAVIVKTVRAAVTNACLVLPVGDDPARGKAVFDALPDLSAVRVKISLPVSTVQMEYRFRLKNAGMTEKIAATASEAAKLCPDVEFEALDATRAEEAFLIDACRTAVENGATAITLCDDAGETLPEEFAALVSSVKKAVNADVFVKTSDRLGMASSNMLAALKAGADGVKVCLESGEGLTLERAAAVLFARGEEAGLTASLESAALHTDVRTLLRSLDKDRQNEARESKEVFVALDAESTPAQLREAALTLGYDLSEEDLGKVLDSLRTICRKKGPVGKREFEAIIASSAMQVPSTYHLDCYTATSGNTTLSVSQVTLVRDGEKISGVASGDGPIDAAFRALEGCIGHHYELDDFQIQSITEGKEALGSALVRLRHEGKLYSGSGISTDIVGASIRAYVNALNKIVYEG
ncbi:MAG: hypothetical protein IJU52_03365 [Clostridia bacterium]|nr:hypothetical protein [Clostridia bacterium]